MESFRPRLVAGLSIASLLAMTLIAPAIGVAAGSSSSGDVRIVHKGASTFPETGSFTPSGTHDVTTDEFAEDEGEDADISLSDSHGPAVSAPGSAKAKSNPSFINGFEGLNHYQQRYARGGNQFSVEPPDQGMCVGNGYVVEAVNDVLNIFNTAGVSQLPDNTATNIVNGFPRNVNHAIDLNSFYGYAPAIDRSTGIRGPFVTDPSCLYDSGHFFVTVLTLEVVPTTGAFTTVNHLDLAVSATSNPTGAWNIYQLDVTNDGTNTGGVNPGPYLGDYPHIGSDSTGFYITTNAYPWCCNGFSGAQIYAMSKSALASGAASVTVVHIDTSHMVNAPSDDSSDPTHQPGFTVWPAQGNGGGGNKEFFLSSNAADESQRPMSGTPGTRTSNQIALWTLSNTNSLNSASPSVTLSNTLLGVGQYSVPPKQQQPGSGTVPLKTTTPEVAQGDCLNDNTEVTIAGVGCWRLLVTPAAHAAGGVEVISRPDSNDSRMQQVWFANGKVWGALDTALDPGAGIRAGIAYYVINPNAAKVDLSGYLGADGYDFTYPAVAVTNSGRGMIAFTATGNTLNPSAGYASLDAKIGAGPWSVVPGGQGATVDDGFTSYKAQVGTPPRTRWGDYGAAATDGNNIWIASEYIAHRCDYIPWGGPFFVGGTGDNLLGTCGGASHGPGTRSALANWSTFISQFTP